MTLDAEFKELVRKWYEQDDQRRNRMLNVLGAIGHFFKQCGIFVGDAFVKIFGSDAAHTFAVGAMAVLRTALGQIVMTVVQEVEATGAPGSEKHGIAFGKILSATAAAGIEAKDSLINTLIELAVQELKGAFGPAKS
jgi:hypothetical protein